MGSGHNPSWDTKIFQTVPTLLSPSCQHTGHFIPQPSLALYSILFLCQLFSSGLPSSIPLPLLSAFFSADLSVHQDHLGLQKYSSLFEYGTAGVLEDTAFELLISHSIYNHLFPRQNQQLYLYLPISVLILNFISNFLNKKCTWVLKSLNFAIHSVVLVQVT